MIPNSPSLKFNWPVETLASLLNVVKVEGLGAINDKTGFYSIWPSQENWEPLVNRMLAATDFLLDENERQAIEAKLNTIELEFNQYLSANDPGNTVQQRKLLENLKDVQMLIFQPRICTHASYPYFARWITLNLAVLRATRGDIQQRGVQIWSDCRPYLELCLHSAGLEGSNDIEIRSTGALNDRLYVYDRRKGFALTTDIAAGDEQEGNIFEILSFAKNLSVQRYRDGLSLDDGIEILSLARAGVAVNEDSEVKQDQLCDLKYLRSAQPGPEANAKSQELACPECLDKIATPQLLAWARKPDGASIEKAELRLSGNEVVSDVFITMGTSLIGAIPIFGDFFNSTIGMLIRWLTPEKPDPWIEFEGKMRLLVKFELEKSVADRLSGTLKGLDEEMNYLLRSYCSEYQKARPGSTDWMRQFHHRAETMISNLNVLQTEIGSSTSPYTKAPFYEHCFLLYIAAIMFARKIGASQVEELTRRRRDVYTAFSIYIRLAARGIALSRGEDIKTKTYEDGKSSYPVIYDHRIEADLSPRTDYKVGSQILEDLLPAIRQLAGITAASQMLRCLTKNVVSIAAADREVGFNTLLIHDAYKAAMVEIGEVQFGRLLEPALTTDLYRFYRGNGLDMVSVLHQDIKNFVVSNSQFHQYYGINTVPNANIFNVGDRR